MQDTGLESNGLGGESVLVVAPASRPRPAAHAVHELPFNQRTNVSVPRQIVGRTGRLVLDESELALQPTPVAPYYRDELF